MKKIIFAAVMSLLLCSEAQAQTILLALVYLNPGKSFKQARRYFKQVNRLSQKYGIRIVELSKVKQVLVPGEAQGVAGYVKWEVDDMQKLGEFFSSLAYTENFVQRRDRIFDMSKATLLVVK